MADSPPPKRRYSSSPSPPREKERGQSRSRSPPRSPRRSDRSDRNDRGGDRSDRSDRTRDRSSERGRKMKIDSSNPGNNLYVTGLSTRVNEKDLEDHFSQEGKVLECRLVLDPRTRESRGFGFVTMERLEDAERCMKYLNRSTLEGRMITVEKAKRKRARTPTPGEYLGVRAVPSRRGGRSGGFHRDGRSQRHSPEYLPYGGGRDKSPRYSPYRSQRDRSLSPEYAPYRR